jgi:hypothetical protein
MRAAGVSASESARAVGVSAAPDYRPWTLIVNARELTEIHDKSMSDSLTRWARRRGFSREFTIPFSPGADTSSTV